MTHARCLAAVLLLTVTSCTEEPPPPAGNPLVLVRVSPSTLPPDGRSKATISIEAKGASGAPLTGTATLSLSSSFGTLSTTSVTLDASGKGSAEITACAGCDSGTRVTIKATVGSAQGQASITFTTPAVTGAEICDKPGDDNGNGAADCGDDACLFRTCVAGRTDFLCRTSGTCECKFGETGGEVTCDDGRDNDCDGRADCDDADCQGHSCGTNLACDINGQCSAAASAPGETVGAVVMSTTTSKGKLSAIGDESAVITTTIKSKSSGAGVRDVAVRFTAVWVSRNVGVDALSDGRSDVVVTTDGNGVATVALRPPANETGSIKVTASITSPVAASQQVFVIVVGLGEITFVEAETLVMGVKTSGFNEQNELTFLVKDTDGQPFNGVPVHFTLATNLTGALVAPYAVSENGVVKTRLYAGTTAGTVNVIATASVGGISISTPSDAIAIIGAKASSKNFHLLCSPNNIPALAEHDCSFSWVAAESVCTVTIGDRFNNTFAKGGEVFFTPEAGLMGASAKSPAYTGQGDPTSPSLGKASMTLSSLSARLPKDVPPVANEGQSTLSGDICGRTVVNQRDGLVTVIAYTQGEEGFIDVNNNGTYDAGTEFFYDLGEPFVDANDNNAWDSDEMFVDTNGNHTYDGPNGRWDADATIWTEFRVLYTGRPVTMRVTPSSPSMYRESQMVIALDFQDLNRNLLPPVSTYAVDTFGCDFLRAEVLFSGARGPSDYGYGFEYALPTTCNSTTRACRVQTALSFHPSTGDWSGMNVGLNSDAGTDLPFPVSCALSATVTLSGNGAERVDRFGTTVTVTGP